MKRVLFLFGVVLVAATAFAQYPIDPVQLQNDATAFEMITTAPEGLPVRTEVEPWVHRGVVKPHIFGRFPSDDLQQVERLVNDYYAAGVEVLYIVGHSADNFTTSQITAMRRASDVAHDHGMKVGLYTGPFGLENQAAIDQYPILEDWFQLDRSGTPVTAWGGNTFCPLSPYPMIFRLKLTRQLVEQCNLDGIFLDIPWLFTNACYCARCTTVFRQHMGQPGLLLPALDDYANPLLPDFLEWRYQTIRNILEAFARELKTERSNLFFMGNYSAQFSSVEAFHLHGLYPRRANPSADSILTELTPFLLGEPEWLVGAMIQSAVSETGRPVYHALVLDEDEELAPPAHVLHSHAEVLASNGTLMHRYPLSQEILGPANGPFIAAIRQANMFQRDHHDLFTTATSIAPQAIVYSRASALWARDASHASFGGINHISRYIRHWLGLYLAALYSQNPVDVLTDDQLTTAELNRYKLVLLPEAISLDTQDIQQLSAFVRNGGTLVVTGLCGVYDRRGARRSSYPPDWPLPTIVPDPLPSASTPPVEYSLGNGRFVHYPGPVDRSAWEATTVAEAKRLASALLSTLGSAELVSLQPIGTASDTMPLVRVTAYRHESQALIHLVNYSSNQINYRGAAQPSTFGTKRFISSIDSLGPLRLKFRYSGDFSTAELVSIDSQETQPLSIHRSGDMYEVVLPRLQTYAVVVFHEREGSAFIEEAVQRGLQDRGSAQGPTWGDYDGDGDDDLLLCVDSNGAARLFQNDGTGVFSERLEAFASSSLLESNAAAWFDYDRDGDLDVFFGAYAQPSRLFRNEGGSSFANVSALLSTNDSEFDNVFALAVGDFIKNGYADIFHAVMSNTAGYNRLWANTPTGFSDAIVAPLSTRLSPRSANAIDFDNDGHLDLFLCRAGAGVPSVLYRNNGDGSWTDIASGGPLANTGKTGRGAAWGDLDNDGDLDVVLANYGQENLLARNEGNGRFEQITGTPINTGVIDAVCPVLLDYDNDGDLDVVIHAIGPTGTAALYRNEGAFTFTDITLTDAPAFASNLCDGRGMAVADADDDGDMDIYRANASTTVGDGNSYFYLNQTNNANWLKVKVTGHASDPQAFGAHVSVFKAGTRILVGFRQIQSQTGYEAFNSLVQHFGVPAGEIFDVEVRFPRSETTRTIHNVTPAQTLIVEEQSPSGVGQTWFHYQ